MTTLLTIPQAARLIGVHKVAVYLAMHRGTLPVEFGHELPHKNGRSGRNVVALVRREDAEDYRDRNAVMRAKIKAWRANRQA